MTATSTPTLATAAEPEHLTIQPKLKWQKYGTPLAVALLEAAAVFTITWEYVGIWPGTWFAGFGA